MHILVMSILDVASLLRVAARYDTRVVKGTAAPPTETPTQGSQVPQTPRKAYLAHAFAKERAKRTVVEAEASGVQGTAAATISKLGQERIIGKSDLLDMNYLELAIAIARGVARVRLPDGAGTGFLVGPGILMTNHHVLPDRATASASVAQFDYQEDSARELLPVQAFSFDPSVFITNPELDFTLVALADRSLDGCPIAAYPWIKLIATIGKAEKGDAINVIQHPLGGLKQIALRDNKVIEIPTGKADFLYYTSDTQPGSSGAPCFNDQWELVALHHSGVPRTDGQTILKKDGTPFREGKDPPDTIEWIANEGGRVSAIVAALQGNALNGLAAAARDQIVSSTTAPNPVELARASVPKTDPSNGKEGTRMEKASGVSVVINISGNEIQSVTVDRGLETTTAMPRPVAEAEPSPVGTPATQTETTAIDPDWKSREGYDPEFLGVRIGLPKLSEQQAGDSVVVPPEYRKKPTEKFVLNYHHFSLAFNAKRRLAWYSAANVDGDRRYKFERGKDKWSIDPRIDDPSNPTLQMGEELYSEKDTDRGHLTRYLDVAWGSSKSEAVAATNDTFHFSNCSLQISAFNQGKDRWQGIEQFLLEQKARKEKRRMVVMTGPVFKRNDPVYRNKHMDYSIRLPLAFWKVCALIREDGSLAATGFVLGQPDVADLPDVEEKFDVTAAQVTIAHLERITGLDFGVLKEHDHFAESGEPGTLEVQRDDCTHRIRLLSGPEEIVI